MHCLVETTGLPTLPILPAPAQDNLPVPVNLTISVDLSGILPEGLRDPRTRTMVVNLEQIYILTITSTTQLETLKVDFVKRAIQVLCWECFQIGILKRNFKMWLQTSPPNTPGLDMEDFALWTMTCPGKKFLTFTWFHMIKDTFTFEPITLKAHKNEMKFPSMVWSSFEIQSTYYKLVVVHFWKISIALPLASFPCWSLVITKSCLEHPALLAGCVCTFSKEVKPVFRLDDLLPACMLFQLFPLTSIWWTRINEYFHQFWMSKETGFSSWRSFTWMYFILSQLLSLAFTWWTWVHEYVYSFEQAGGMAVLLLAMPTKLWSLDRKRMWTHILVPAIPLWMTWWSCWNIGHEGWIFFSSCLLYHHETRNIFFHDFGTGCLSFCTSVCVHPKTSWNYINNSYKIYKLLLNTSKYNYFSSVFF